MATIWKYVLPPFFFKKKKSWFSVCDLHVFLTTYLGPTPNIHPLNFFLFIDFSFPFFPVFFLFIFTIPLNFFTNIILQSYVCGARSFH